MTTRPPTTDHRPLTTGVIQSGSPMIGALEQTIRRDRVLAFVGVAAISALAWWYLISSKASMTSMSAVVMVDPRTWGAADWLELFVIWAVI